MFYLSRIVTRAMGYERDMNSHIIHIKIKLQMQMQITLPTKMRNFRRLRYHLQTAFFCILSTSFN